MSRWLDKNNPEAWGSLASSGRPDHVVADSGSEYSHESRLRACLRLPILPGDHVIDFACGTGRLADLLPRYVTYEGIDWSEDIIKEAKRRRPRYHFKVGTAHDLPSFGAAEWVIASGPFNMADGWSKQQTQATLHRMWGASMRGIAVTVRYRPEPNRLHYTPNEMLGYLHGWQNLVFDTSYLPEDMCVRAWRGNDRIEP